MKKFPWVNEKGQEFEPFKMLIFVIMAFVMLFFILSSLNYFEGQKVSISNTQLKNGLKSAAEAPQVINKEKPLRLKELFFDKATFSARSLAELFALGGEECINLYARPTAPAFEMKSNFKILEINQKLQSDVFIYCDIPIPITDPTNPKYNEAIVDCVVACNIYFGIMPTEFEKLATQPPTATIDANTTSGDTPLSIRFTGSATVPAGVTITKYEWVFEGTATEPVTGWVQGISTETHFFNTPGFFTSWLRVTDSMGLTDTDSIVITVSTA